MIAPDFSRQRAPEPAPYLIRGPESIAVALVEGQIVRTDDLHGDSRPLGCGQGLHVSAGGKKTSETNRPDLHGDSRPQGCAQGRAQ